MFLLQRHGSLLLGLLVLSACSSSDRPSPPKNLLYPTVTARYLPGTAIPENRPTFVGSGISFFSDPELPEGLALHPSTGTISGTPTSSQPATGYTITAANSAGHTTAAISIEVTAERFAFSSSTADDSLLGYVVHEDRLLFNGFTVAPAGESGPGVPLVSPGGAVLYVPNDDTANVSVYVIDAATGQLTPGEPVAVGTGPQTMVLNTGGSLAWVASAGADELRTFAVDGQTGSLTQVGAAVTTADEPVGIALSPDGAFLFVAAAGGNGSVQGYAIAEDGTPSASGTPWNSVGGALKQVRVAPDGTAVLVTLDAYGGFLVLLAVNGADGSLSQADQLGVSGAVQGLEISSTGLAALLAVDAGASEKLVSVPLTEGPALGTAVNTVIDGGPEHLLVSGSRLFVTSADDGEIDIYELDPLTAVPAPARSFRTRGAPSGLGLATGASILAPRASHIYTINGGSDEVSAFEINALDGTLTGGIATSTSPAPRALALDPLGEYAWVACPTANAIEVCAVDGTTGALTVLETHDLGADEPYALCVDAAGANLYVATRTDGGGGQLDTFPINRASGGLDIRIGLSLDEAPRQIVLDPTGRFLFVATEENSSSIETFAVDPHNGFPTETGIILGTQSGANDVELRFAPTGARLFIAYDSLPVQLLFSAAIDPQSGALTTGGIQNTSPGTAQACEPHPSGAFAYVAVQETGNDHTSSFDLDEASGALSNETETSAGISPADLRIDPTGAFLWVANEGGGDISLFAIDETTGTLTLTDTTPTGTTPGALRVRVILE